MANAAKVLSLNALVSLRTQLCLFTVRARSALDQLAGEARSVKHWLREDRMPYWRKQVHQQLVLVADARAALNRARLSEAKVSHADEQMAVTAALQALRDAEEKVRCIRAWTGKLDPACQPLLGKMHALANILSNDMPKAIAYVDGLIESLEGYAAVTTTPQASPGNARAANTEAGDEDAAPAPVPDAAEPDEPVVDANGHPTGG